LFVSGVIDTGGKFATGINNTSKLVAKFATGDIDIGGNLPPASVTPAANFPPVSKTLAKLLAKFASGIVDTVERFSACVVDTGGNFAGR
jgi:hypothetical protein